MLALQKQGARVKIRPDKFIRSIVAKAYPEYKGRKFFLSVTDAPLDVRSYWDEGSRTYYTFANLATGEVSQQVPAQSAYDKQIGGANAVSLPQGFACVTHSYYCGRDCGVTIIVNPENAAKFLPAEANQ